MPQNVLNVALPEHEISSIEYSMVTEPEYMVVFEEKEYQQVQGLCTDPTADSSDDDFQEAGAAEIDVDDDGEFAVPETKQ